jgi:hypothetical protein
MTDGELLDDFQTHRDTSGQDAFGFWSSGMVRWFCQFAEAC